VTWVEYYKSNSTTINNLHCEVESCSIPGLA